MLWSKKNLCCIKCPTDFFSATHYSSAVAKHDCPASSNLTDTTILYIYNLVEERLREIYYIKSLEQYNSILTDDDKSLSSREEE
jgi:hypothetical protein